MRKYFIFKAKNLLTGKEVTSSYIGMYSPMRFRFTKEVRSIYNKLKDGEENIEITILHEFTNPKEFKEALKQYK